MDRSRWLKIKQLVGALHQMPKGGRKSWLRAQCHGDRVLYKQVVHLYRAEQETTRRPGRDRSVAGPMVGQLAGMVVGRWRLLRELGSGGMGSVWLSERADSEFKMPAAVKLIKREHADQEQVQRFRRERQILADLKHPNIAMLLDGGTTDDGLPYLVMEYVDGQNIAAYCLSGKTDTRTRLKIFRDACKAVAHAHHRGILHRDIKPSNLMVRKDGLVKLVDFGIAGFEEPQSGTADLTRGRIAPMTPDYASPERLAGRRVTEADDIYSLGLVLFYILTGRRPKSVGGNWEVVLRAALAENPDDRLLEGCVELLTRVLGPAAWRPATADALVAEVEEVWTLPTSLDDSSLAFAELELTLNEEDADSADDEDALSSEDTLTMPSQDSAVSEGLRSAQQMVLQLKQIMAEAGRLWKQGVADEALAKLLEADALSPRNTEVHKRLVMVYQKLGRRRQAAAAQVVLVEAALAADDLTAAAAVIAELKTLDADLAARLQRRLDEATAVAGFEEEAVADTFGFDFGDNLPPEPAHDAFDLNMGAHQMDVLDMREVRSYETHTRQVANPTFSGEWSLDWNLGDEATGGASPPEVDLREIDNFIADRSFELARGMLEAVRNHYGDHASLREREQRIPPRSKD